LPLLKNSSPLPLPQVPTPILLYILTTLWLTLANPLILPKTHTSVHNPLLVQAMLPSLLLTMLDTFLFHLVSFPTVSFQLNLTHLLEEILLPNPRMLSTSIPSPAACHLASAHQLQNLMAIQDLFNASLRRLSL
jgi:hypothetical protein